MKAEKTLVIIPKLPKEEFEKIVKLWRDENSVFLRENGDSKFITDVIRAEGGKTLFTLTMVIE